MIFKELSAVEQCCFISDFQKLIFSHFQKLYLNFGALLLTDHVLLLRSGFYDLEYSNRNGEFLITVFYFHVYIFNFSDIELIRKINMILK